MSNLRDIRTPDHFKTFANTLRRNVSALNTVSLQRLQHEIAIALGARNLEAFYAQSEQKQTTTFNPFPFIPYVLVLDEGKGTSFLVANDFFRTPLFSELTEGKLTVVSEEKANDMLYLRNPFVSIQPLNEACPELAALMNAQSITELEKTIRDQHTEGALDCVGFWFDADTWRDEVSAGNTSRSYVEWVLSELEQWRDEQVVSAYNATSQGNSTALYPYRVVVTEDSGDSTTGEFYCLAENDDHAYEQAEDAYPNGEAKLATRLDPKDYPYEIHPENNVVNGSQD